MLCTHCVNLLRTFPSSARTTRRRPHHQRNGFFQLADHHAIAVGGGGGFGFYLDAGLLRGSSERCDTFDNACLTETRSFDCANVEVWVPRLAAL